MKVYEPSVTHAIDLIPPVRTDGLHHILYICNYIFIVAGMKHKPAFGLYNNHIFVIRSVSLLFLINLITTVDSQPHSPVRDSVELFTVIIPFLA